jgi:hypothetical protein
MKYKLLAFIGIVVVFKSYIFVFLQRTNLIYNRKETTATDSIIFKIQYPKAI